MTNELFLTRLLQWGVLSSLVAAAFPDLAFAESVAESINNVTMASANQVPVLINAIAFAGGAALGVSGALKLKAYTDNPGQEKISAGIGRLLAGGGLAALPMLLETAVETLHLDRTDAIAVTTFGMDNY